MREMSAGFECSYGKLSPYGFILNSTHGVLVGMVIKPSGRVAHTNHLCGPELIENHNSSTTLDWCVKILSSKSPRKTDTSSKAA